MGVTAAKMAIMVSNWGVVLYKNGIEFSRKGVFVSFLKKVPHKLTTKSKPISNQ